jgi:hypothetical protein
MNYRDPALHPNRCIILQVALASLPSILFFNNFTMYIYRIQHDVQYSLLWFLKTLHMQAILGSFLPSEHIN